MAEFLRTINVPRACEATAAARLMLRVVRCNERALAGRAADVVGNSLGGYVAWMLAARHAGMVSKLVLEDAAGPFERPHITFAFRLGRIPVLRLALKFLSPVRVVRQTLEDAFYNDTLVTDAMVTRHHDLLLRAGNRGVRLRRCVPRSSCPPWPERACRRS